MASAWLKEHTSVPTTIGKKVKKIVDIRADLYNLPATFESERDFDCLFSDGDTFSQGELTATVRLSPRLTLGSVSYVIDDREEPAWECTEAEQRAENIHVGDSTP